VDRAAEILCNIPSDQYSYGKDTATNVLLLLLMIMMIVGSDGIVDIKWIEALISNDALSDSYWIRNSTDII
jgi:NhaP-type Na+/H+ and K+/H+ antiporter